MLSSRPCARAASRLRPWCALSHLFSYRSSSPRTTARFVHWSCPRSTRCTRETSTPCSPRTPGDTARAFTKCPNGQEYVSCLVVFIVLLIQHSVANPQDEPEGFLKVYFSAPHITCTLYFTPPYNLKQDNLNFTLLDALQHQLVLQHRLEDLVPRLWDVQQRPRLCILVCGVQDDMGKCSDVQGI